MIFSNLLTFASAASAAAAAALTHIAPRPKLAPQHEAAALQALGPEGLRAAHVASYASMGDDGINALLQSVHDSDVEVRWWATDTIARLPVTESARACSYYSS